MTRQPPKSSKQQSPTKDSARATFGGHLTELRNRLFIVALLFFAATCVGYSLHEQIIRVLVAPLDGQKLIYLTPGGGFDFIFRVSLYFGLCVTIPVVLFHVYRFLRPMLQTVGVRFTVLLLLGSIVLAAGGIIFGYFVAIPSALQFLTQFGGEYINASLTASSYLGFIVAYLLGLAVLFQLPLLLILINNIGGPLKPSRLLASERYVIMGAFVAAAIITPTPDIINQILLAGPIIAVYQLGVVSVWVQNRRRRAGPKIALKEVRARPPERELSSVHATPLPTTRPGAVPQTSLLAHHSRRMAVDIMATKKPRLAAVAPKQQGITYKPKRPRLTITGSRQRLATIDGFFPCSDKHNRILF